MTVKSVQCTLCGDEVYSRHFDDERSCGCKNLSVSGGYINPTVSCRNHYYEVMEFRTTLTPIELAVDFLEKENKYGLFRGR